LKLTIVKYNKLTGIGDHVIYALNRLFKKKRGEILYFDFCNFFYTNVKNKNIWEEFFYQPFKQYENTIRQKIKSNDYDLEYNKPIKNELIYTTKNGLNNLKNYKKIKKLRKIFKKYIRFKSTIMKEADIFYKKNIKNNSMSVHLRGTDKFLGHAKNVDFIINFQEKVIKKIKKFKDKKKISKIFLATDDKDMKKMMQENFRNSLIGKNILLKKNKDALHFGSIFESEKIKIKSCKDALIDAILIARCDESLVCQSNLSIISILIRKDSKYHFLDSDINYS
jgi:hypothetical protein